MTLDNSLINDTFMYPYAMEYNAPLTPVYNFNYSCNNNNNNSRMVSSWDISKTFFFWIELQVKMSTLNYFLGERQQQNMKKSRGRGLININQRISNPLVGCFSLNFPINETYTQCV